MPHPQIQHLIIEGIDAPLKIRINPRARRLILSVDPVNCTINLTVPQQNLIEDAIAFAHERRDWIRAQLTPDKRAIPFGEKIVVPFQGQDHLIVRDGGPRAPIRRITGSPPQICVGGDAAHINRRVTDWLRREARARFIECTDIYCARLKVKRSAVRVRDSKTRWGSCSSTGVLSFSWRLILAPPEILEYVAAHECAHLVHMNHSPAFWRLVATLDVDARAATRWFERHGADLFRYGVEPTTPDLLPAQRAGAISAANGSSLAGAA